ncbi:hypothetical protein LTR97_002987 [Elasticomyces elasticus]|uniref:Uncharacterized protein n=1 Tax=Elasticomyces elasticus TaxID=574655 RepID=A0AAN7WFW3_9PEZI|nr:hypothetical protein LTR97_002987 [Elasticomyces elasticus]KAK5725818.1 hypothetical protein LTR15_004008 [Elasticomyces elasticus]
MDDAAKAAFEMVQKLFGHLISGLKNVRWEDLPQGTRDHIANNPKMCAVQIVMVLTAVVPGLVMAPGLAALGFGALGPGGAAAGFQSVWGTPALFSALQSAAMGGYGTAIVGGAVSAASAAGGVVVEFFKKR